ncbi:MAG: hypothetical protein J6Y00_01465 [Paludibacteraceae bacterium]|nr:hypothetical protein [Paludibacteraceae bacterium]
MSKGIEDIGKTDVVWSYLATVFLIGAGVILLPFILNKMPAEAVGIWNIFTVIIMLVNILDFGFSPSFARNLSYIFSGAKELQKEGVRQVSDGEVDYGLLKGTLTAMRRFYLWIAIACFGLLATAGTAYFAYILRKYTGDKTDAMIAWLLLIAINCYNLYTLYYDALLLGKGYIKRNQQIIIVAQGTYLILAIGLIYAGLGLSAIVGAQLVATVVRRILAYRTFFTREMRASLKEAQEQDAREILRVIYPNAVKVGLTQLGAFAINKSAVLIGSVYLSLEAVACYGITLQVMDVLTRCATVPYRSFIPKLAQARAENDIEQLRRYYKISAFCILGTYIAGSLVWIGFGDVALQLIHSETSFVPLAMLVAILVIRYLEDNHAMSAGFIMADNKIPFFIPSLVSGAVTLVLLFVFLGPLHSGMWGLILAGGIAQAAYQNWKWPTMVIRELWSGR